MTGLHYVSDRLLACRMERKMKAINATALTIAIIGCLNWGLIGIFRFDLVAWIFGDMSWISRIVYTLVGLSGLYLVTFFGRLGDRNDA